MASHILDAELHTDLTKQDVESIDVTKFLILDVATFGLYGLWWMYKSWRFFREKDNLDIMPAARAIFAIFFLSGLFSRIKQFALTNGYTKDYPAGGLAFAFIVLNILSRLPDPLWMISIASAFCFIQPVKAFNFAIENSSTYRIIQNGFTPKRIVLLLVGLVLWALILIGYATADNF